MSDRLQQLQAQIEAIPEPTDPLAKAQVSLVKLQAKVLAKIPELDGTAEQKLDVLKNSEPTIDTVEGMLGASHAGVVRLREMAALVRSRIEGRPDPAGGKK